MSDVTVTVKRGRGRPRLNRMEALKNFVTQLQKEFGTTGPYTRDQLETIGDSNLLGMQLFTSGKKGYGAMTRLSHGSYRVPTEWENTPPWQVETTEVV